VAGIYGKLDAESIRRRARALGRFNEWEKAHRPDPSPAEAIAAVAFLFDLLPQESRSRPVDATGVMRMHRCLAVLPGSRR